MCEVPEVMAGHLPAGAARGSSVGTWTGAPPPTHCWFQSPGALPGAPVTALLVLPPSLDIQPGWGLWLWGLLPAEIQDEQRPRGDQAGCGQACPSSGLGAAGGLVDLGHPSHLSTNSFQTCSKGIPLFYTCNKPTSGHTLGAPEFRSLKGPLGASGTRSRETPGSCEPLDLASPLPGTNGTHRAQVMLSALERGRWVLIPPPCVCSSGSLHVPWSTRQFLHEKHHSHLKNPEAPRSCPHFWGSRCPDLSSH